ncbi:hypothetical protein AAFN86_28875 [Roseomonas sp. CAU 1739]|uniref:hypothetical protein n=1 Tax=Roseomonas sp. CAU 1739 TaxID=3140364 RepID=UPI00325B8222
MDGPQARVENPKNLVQSVAEAFVVLNAFGADRPEPTVAEVAAHTGHGLRTVAAPVLDARGAPAAGVSLTVGGGRMTLPDFIALTAPRVCALAEELGTGLRLSFGAIGSGGASR